MREHRCFLESSRIAEAWSKQTLDSADYAQAVILAGLELGLNPYVALRELILTGNKIQMSVQLAYALAARCGVRLASLSTERYGEGDETIDMFEIVLTRDGKNLAYTYTSREAERAGHVKFLENDKFGVLFWGGMSHALPLVAPDALLVARPLIDPDFKRRATYGEFNFIELPTMIGVEEAYWYADKMVSAGLVRLESHAEIVAAILAGAELGIYPFTSAFGIKIAYTGTDGRLVISPPLRLALASRRADVWVNKIEMAQDGALCATVELARLTDQTLENRGSRSIRSTSQAHEGYISPKYLRWEAISAGVYNLTPEVLFEKCPFAPTYDGNHIRASINCAVAAGCAPQGASFETLKEICELGRELHLGPFASMRAFTVIGDQIKLRPECSLAIARILGEDVHVERCELEGDTVTVHLCLQGNTIVHKFPYTDSTDGTQDQNTLLWLAIEHALKIYCPNFTIAAIYGGRYAW